MAKDDGTVNIHGKTYQTVALRVRNFRDKYPDHSLITEVLHRDLDCVVLRATISDPAGRVIATGHAEEYRKASSINKTSALENAETSAIGRALAAFGLGGTEFASADEVARAVSGEKGEAPRFPSPVKSALVELTDEQQQQAADIRLAIIDLHERFTKGEDVRYQVYELLELTDSDVKLGVWNAMAAESKQRNWAKKVQGEVRAELRAEEAA